MRRYARKTRYSFPCKNGGTKVKELICFCLKDPDLFKSDRSFFKQLNEYVVTSNDIITSVASVRSFKGSRIYKEYVIFTDRKDLYISYPYENANDVIGIYSKKNIKRNVRIRTKYVVKLGSVSV